ncbi:ABC transporter permease [Halorubellus salinus]|uniref:ABC transporter permease n=1 Tax=Halorubellus salinus TaxID=755309 RepID=UPI001D06EC03|nr:ABC transporter permease [Halorubellus salinus]
MYPPLTILGDTLTWLVENQQSVIEQTIQHLNVSLTSVGIALVLWVPLGLFLHEHDEFAPPVIGTAGMILTLPSLALLPLLIPIVGIGVAPAVVALVLYSALPMIRNTYTGLEEVDESMVRAGRGLGMTDRELLFKVKIPMALPVIFAGIRQAAVLVIGITTIAAFFGAGGLGESIFAGIRLDFPRQVLGATIVVSVIAIATDYGLLAVQRALPGGSEAT